MSKFNFNETQFTLKNKIGEVTITSNIVIDGIKIPVETTFNLKGIDESKHSVIVKAAINAYNKNLIVR